MASTRPISAATPGGREPRRGSRRLRILALGDQVGRQHLGDPLPPRRARRVPRRGRSRPPRPAGRRRTRAWRPIPGRSSPAAGRRAGPSSRAAARPTAVPASAPSGGPIGPPRAAPRPGPEPAAPVPARAGSSRCAPFPGLVAQVQRRPFHPTDRRRGRVDHRPSPLGPTSAPARDPLAPASRCCTTSRPPGHGLPGARRSPRVPTRPSSSPSAAAGDDRGAPPAAPGRLRPGRSPRASPSRKSHATMLDIFPMPGTGPAPAASRRRIRCPCRRQSGR